MNKPRNTTHLIAIFFLLVAICLFVARSLLGGYFSINGALIHPTYFLIIGLFFEVISKRTAKRGKDGASDN